MSREVVIEESRHVRAKPNTEQQRILNELRETLGDKYYFDLDSFLTGILLTLKEDKRDLILDHIKSHVNLYIYLNKPILSIIISDTNMDDKSLNELKSKIEEDNIPKVLKLKLDKDISDDFKTLYKLKYHALLIRYVEFLLSITKG